MASTNEGRENRKKPAETNDIKLMLSGLALGFRDAICGTWAFVHLNPKEDADKKRKSLVLETRGSKEDQIHADKRRKPQVVEPRSSKEENANNKLKGTKSDGPRIVNRILRCCALNGGVFGFSIVIFNYIALPTLAAVTHFIFGNSPGLAMTVWSWLLPVLSYTFGAIWEIPVFLITRIVNIMWFQDIADEAYKVKFGRPGKTQALGSLLADLTFSTVIQGLFLIQSNFVGFLPVVGPLASFIHTSLLYSLYAFEYKWMNRGLELHTRLSQIETNWPYYFGFGLPLAMLTSWPPTFFLRGSVFAVAFPLLIISSLEAMPKEGAVHYPLPVFKLVVWLSGVLANVFGIIFGKCGFTVKEGPSKPPQKRSSPKKNEISYRR